MAGIGNGILLNGIGHPEAIVAQLTPATISDPVICTDKCERICRPDGTYGAILEIAYEILHGE